MSEELRLLLVGFCVEVILLIAVYYFLLVPRYWRRMREASDAEREVEDTRKELEAQRKEVMLEARDEAHRLRGKQQIRRDLNGDTFNGGPR